MADQTNYTRPEDKARWGFGGKVGKITIETPDDVTPIVGLAPVEPDDKGAHKHGGGAKGSK